MPIPCLIIAGADYARRERHISEILQQQTSIQRAAILLEGIPSGQAELSTLSQVVHLQRLASGCLCCAGKLVFQVSIQRSLKHHPDYLILALAQTDHQREVLSLLSASSYANWLQTPHIVHLN